MSNIRKAKEHDLAQILELYSYLFSNEDYSERNHFTKKWNEMINFNGLSCFVILEKKQIVSSCMISITPNLSRNQKSYALIENVITHPDYRRQGFGRAVIEHAIKYAIENNCYKIMLLSTASEDRQAAHQFYEELGFDGNSKRGFNIRFDKNEIQ